MQENIQKIEQFANTMIEIGTKIKEVMKEDFINKTEAELTAEDKNKYYQFVGYYISSIQKLNEMRLNL